jgi:hypothetical protein
MDAVYLYVETLSAQGRPLDEIFGKLANLLDTDEAAVTSPYRQALKAHGASTPPTPQKPTEKSALLSASAQISTPPAFQR